MCLYYKDLIHRLSYSSPVKMGASYYTTSVGMCELLKKMYQPFIKQTINCKWFYKQLEHFFCSCHEWGSKSKWFFLVQGYNYIYRMQD